MKTMNRSVLDVQDRSWRCNGCQRGGC